jgi:selenocysteine lyase/cysteine desulfurase
MMDSLTTYSRRRFLGLGGTASASVLLGGDRVFAGVLSAIQGRASRKMQDQEEFWTFLRAQFMVEPGRIYLNAGTTGLMPRPVVEAEARYQSELAANPKVRHLFEYVIVPEEVRQKAATLIGADLAETALTHNTTEGLNIVAHGLPLKAGDQVLITDQEHPGHREPWRLRAKRDGIEVTEVKIPNPLPDAATFLNRIETAITNRTRVIAFPYITTTTGLITPAREVCALARSKGVMTLLDGAHSAGQIKFSVKDIGCDFYATSPHKWLHAPLGNGIFYCRKELQNTLWPLTGAAGWDQFQDARKYSAFGNRSWSTAMALGHAIDFANAIGIENIEARQRALMTKFKSQLLSVGVESLTPAAPAFYCALSAFRIPRVSGHNLSTYLLDKHHIVVSERADGFRADIGYYISWDELDRTVEVVADAIRKGTFKTTAHA